MHAVRVWMNEASAALHEFLIIAFLRKQNVPIPRTLTMLLSKEHVRLRIQVLYCSSVLAVPNVCRTHGHGVRSRLLTGLTMDDIKPLAVPGSV
jgi:hypothetical protein